MRTKRQQSKAHANGAAVPAVTAFNPTLPPEWTHCHSGNGHSGYVSVTPKMARELLERNTLNRRISQPWVNTLTEYIKNGKWQATGEPIIVSRSGRLLDGQHRLMAIVRADRSAQLMLVRDVDDSAIQWIDNGMPRNAFSRAKLAGFISEDTNRREVDIAVFLLGVERGNTRPDHLQIVEALAHIKYEAGLVCTLMSIQRQFITATPVRAALAAFIKTYDVPEDEAAKIIKVLYDGFAVEAIDKALILTRNALLTGAFSTGKNNSRRIETYRRVQRGLMAYQEATCPARLQDPGKLLYTVLPELVTAE